MRPEVAGRSPQASRLAVHAWRSAAAMRYRLLALGLIAALGLALHLGVRSAIASLNDSHAAAVRRGRLADLELRFRPLPAALLPAFDRLPGIAAAEARLLAPGRLRLAGGRTLPALVVVVDPSRPARVNRLTILAGAPLDPRRPGAAVVERRLAALPGCGLGAALEVTLPGRRQRLAVAGIAESAELLLPPANPAALLPARGSLGIVFVASQLMEAGLGARPVNSLLLRFAAGADRPAARRRVLALAATRLAAVESVAREEQLGDQLLLRSLAAAESFLAAALLVFVLATFPVVTFLASQWIAGDRGAIGIAMSLGYGRRRLALAYLGPAALLAGGAIALGAACSWPILRAFAYGFVRALDLPPPELALDPGAAVRGGLGVLLAIGLALGWSHLVLLHGEPLAALRHARRYPRAPRPPRPRRHDGRAATRPAGALWLRYAVRNLRRRAGTSALTLLAAGVGLGVPIAFAICETSFEAAARRLFRDDPWSLVVEFQRPVPAAELARLARLPAVRGVVPYVRGTARLVAAGQARTVVVGGLPPGSAMRGPRLVAGRQLAATDGAAMILERHLAAELGLRPGRRVRLEHGGRSLEATLVGVRHGGLVAGETYLPLGAAQDLLGLRGRVSGAFVRTAGTAGAPAAARRAVEALPLVAQVALKEDAWRTVLDAGAHLQALIRVAAGFSLPLAVLLLFTNFAYALLERRREYVLLRLLGFSDRTVALTILAEVCLLGAAAAVLAAAVGWSAARFLTWRLAQVWITIPVVARAGDFALVLGPALALLPLAAAPAIRRLLAEPLAAPAAGAGQEAA